MIIKKGLTKDEQKNYILRYLLSMKDDIERREYIKSITNNNLLTLAKYQYVKVELIETLQKMGIKPNIVNSTIYPNYLSILKNYKKLADELLLINPIEVSILFSYLLWNGYFSINKHNIYKNENALLPDHLYPYTIMEGVGVCLNHSIMLTDYLNICGINATPIETRVQQCKTPPIYIPPIKREIIETTPKFTLTSLLEPKSTKNGNHVFTLIKENEYFYIYDSTNLMMFAVKSPTKAKCTAANINATLYPIPSYEITVNNKSSEVLNYFITTNKFQECPYPIDYFKFITEQSLKTIIKNINLINDCYDESHEDISIVANHVKKRKIRPSK